MPNRYDKNDPEPCVKSLIRFEDGSEIDVMGEWDKEEQTLGVTDVFDISKDEFYEIYQRNLDLMHRESLPFLASIRMKRESGLDTRNVFDIDFRRPPKDGHRYWQIVITIAHRD